MYTTNMIVNINAVSSSDFGTYTCVSINPLGNTDGVIKLYGKYLASNLDT